MKQELIALKNAAIDEAAKTYGRVVGFVGFCKLLLYEYVDALLGRKQP